jgi:hypothetical protein
VTDRAWYPVALSRELRAGGWLQVRLLDRTWALRRGADGVVTAPGAFDVGERHGLVWLAPAEPGTAPLAVPEIADRSFVVGALAPVRAPGPAAPLLDALVATSDPAAALVRTPSALARRTTDPASGAAATLVVVLQPEDADSTRAYGCVLLREGPGRPLPAPSDVAAAVAREQRLLERSAAARTRLLTA